VIYVGALMGAASSVAAGCQSSSCTERVKARALERAYERTWVRAPLAVRTHLRAIAWCESTNDETAVSGDGRFRGLLQFDMGTWRTVGGVGDPAAAPRWEQWARGVRLYLARGAQPWPVCGSRTAPG